MKKMTQRCLWIMALTVALALSACSHEEGRHLIRSTAKAQLERAFKNSSKYNLTTNIGTISGNCLDLPNHTSDKLDFVQSNKTYAVLSNTGYITIQPVKNHVWDVEPTRQGNGSIGAKYGHTQKTDCDEWQVEFVMAKFDHLDIIGIVEDGVHAKVDTLLAYKITPIGLAVMRQAASTIFKVDERTFGKELAQAFSEHIDLSRQILLGDELARLPLDKDKFALTESIEYVKYDDGWKIVAGHFPPDMRTPDMR